MMVFPGVTSGYLALLALIYLGLSMWVSLGRGQYNAVHGDAGVTMLNRRIRSHANFAEYVPLIVVMVALLEAGGLARVWVHTLLAILVVARLLHPIGMVAGENTAPQFLFRATAATATWVVMLVAAILLLVRLS